MNNELISQWSDIKRAYKAIIDNAFTTQQEKQYAEYIIVKFIGSGIDLFLCGDPSLKKASDALLGNRTPTQNRTPPTTTSSSPPPPNPFTTQFHFHESEPGDLPRIPSSIFNIPQTGVPINTEELGQLFSIWTSIENAVLSPHQQQQQTSNTNTEPVHNPPQNQS